MKRLLLLTACAAAAACSADWRDASLPPQKRAELLTAEMTLDEKIGQLTSPYGWEMYERHGDSVRLTDAFREAVQNSHIGMLWGTFRADPWTQKDLRTGLTPQLAARAGQPNAALRRAALAAGHSPLPRRGSPPRPHGHRGHDIPHGAGTGFDMEPGADRTHGRGHRRRTCLQGGHICYGPVLDIVRDPRWSRTEESYGEDRYLTARIGEAYVRGTGSGDLSQPRHALSTLKHFIAYGASEGGQNGGSNLLGERELRETYLPPFEAAVKAGARSVMTAYNSVDGIPCTANRRMLTDILRGEWGFDGFVVSDLLSIEGLHETHGVAGSVREAAVQALRAGVDADLKGGAFASLREAAEAGDVAEAEIDRAVERVLALKFEMGLFENPYIDEAAAAEVGCAAHSELALEAARAVGDAARKPQRHPAARSPAPAAGSRHRSQRRQHLQPVRGLYGPADNGEHRPGRAGKTAGARPRRLQPRLYGARRRSVGNRGGRLRGPRRRCGGRGHRRIERPRLRHGIPANGRGQSRARRGARHGVRRRFRPSDGSRCSENRKSCCGA